jgi:SAM-dependent methyltransferase
VGPMGVWREQVLPRANHVVLASAVLRGLRAQALEGLHGDVVEIGFGSGQNLPVYPRGVRRVVAVEPAMVARRLARGRLDASGMAVEFIALDASELALPSASMDAAVSTFTLCTVPDAARALAELFRVLVPGGRLHLLEHGRSPDGRVAAWQRRLNPLQRRVAGGCHLDRPIQDLVEGAGFDAGALRSEDMAVPAPFRPFAHLFLGNALKPAPGPTG